MHPHELLFMKGLVTIASNITVIWSLTEICSNIIFPLAFRNFNIMTRLSKQLFSGILNFVLNFSSVYLFSNDLLCTPGILLVDKSRHSRFWLDDEKTGPPVRGSTDIPVSKYLNISLSPGRVEWASEPGWIAGPDISSQSRHRPAISHHYWPRPLGSVFPGPHTGSDHITQPSQPSRGQ